MKMRPLIAIALALLFIIGDAIFGFIVGAFVAASCYVALASLGAAIATFGGLAGLAIGIILWDFVMLPHVWRAVDKWLMEKHNTTAEQVIEKFFE